MRPIHRDEPISMILDGVVTTESNAQILSDDQIKAKKLVALIKEIKATRTIEGEAVSVNAAIDMATEILNSLKNYRDCVTQAIAWSYDD